VDSGVTVIDWVKMGYRSGLVFALSFIVINGIVNTYAEQYNSLEVGCGFLSMLLCVNLGHYFDDIL